MNKFLITEDPKLGTNIVLQMPLQAQHPTRVERVLPHAMELIMSGDAENGLKILRYKYYFDRVLMAGNLLAYGWQFGWFGEENSIRAYYILKKMIDKDSSIALNNLAHVYQLGRGTKQNVRTAISYYEKSIKLGCHVAKVNLANLLIWNEKYQDIERGITLAHEAAEEHISEGFFILAKCYEQGIYFEQDLSKAKENYLLAAEHDEDNNPFYQHQAC